MKAETMSIHSGFAQDRYSGATAVPVYQTVSYSYQTAQELADVFDGKVPGYMYTRIANPTTTALEVRLAELENGIGCIATASGMAAISSVVLGLVRSGDRIITAAEVFGGTASLFRRVLERFGVQAARAKASATDNFARLIDDKTKLIYVESMSNPQYIVPDIPAIAAIAHQANIPLVVDNTLATPVLFNPGNYGADIVVHSTSKYINGHGTAIGGALIDTGNYDWSKGVFADIRLLSETVGSLAFLVHLRNVICKDLGGCPAPMNSFLMLQGLETLPARMSRHCENAARLAGFLQNHPRVAWVNYPGLPGNTNRKQLEKLFTGGSGGMLSFGLGSRRKAFAFIDSLKLVKNLANLGDAKTLAIHPASTIFHEFSETEKREMEITDDMVRVSVGIENFDDIKADFAQAIEQCVKE